MASKNGSALTTQRDLLTVNIQTLYNMEEQLIEALPLLIESATEEELKNALEDHLEVTKLQRDRLGEISRALDIDPKGMEDTTLTQMLDQGQMMIEKAGDPMLKDEAIMGGTLKVEHYEMAAYMVAISIAKKLEEDDTVDMLKESHKEEVTAAELVETLSSQGLISNIKKAIM